MTSRRFYLWTREGWQNGYCTSLENWRPQGLGGSNPSPSVSPRLRTSNQESIDNRGLIENRGSLTRVPKLALVSLRSSLNPDS